MGRLLTSCWTLEEIRSGAAFRKHTFFNYKGWSEEHGHVSQRKPDLLPDTFPTGRGAEEVRKAGELEIGSSLIIRRPQAKPPLTRDDIRRITAVDDSALTVLTDSEILWKGSYAGSEYLIRIAPNSEELSTSDFDCEDDDFIEFLGMLRQLAWALEARVITDGRDITD
jgi:hypothetical protein